MSNHYEECLKRLVQYRLQVNMTQEKIGQVLGITQSQLSKQELGKTIMTFHSLCILMDIGWDVDFLFTGECSRREPSEISAILEGMKQASRRSMLEFIAWALEKGIEQSGNELSVEEQREISLLKLRSSTGIKQPIMYEIRKILGVAQIPMAEKIGVNIKKYRSLERAQIYPDAELLLDIYEATGCRPSLFLASDRMETLIIDGLWSRVSPDRQKDILAITSQVDKFLRK